MDKKELIKFVDGDIEIDVSVSPEQETVWLSQKQMSELFETTSNNIGIHIRNIYKEEELILDSTTKDSFVVQIENSREVKRQVKMYNLDMIISVGYRVKSRRGIIFRKWANEVLKEYLLKGYIINKNKIDIPNHNKIIDLLDSYRKDIGALNISTNQLLDFLVAYQKGLKILDDYDHHTLTVSTGIKETYRITYDECMKVINQSTFKKSENVFAIERDDSFKSSISVIYQSFDGQELYPTLEDKAANLLYFVTKNHSFIDGNKRISAIIFLYFLEKNNAIYVDGKRRIDEETLATLTILIASSKVEDREQIVNLILVLLQP